LSSLGTLSTQLVRGPYANDIAPALDTGATVIEDRGLHTMYSYSLAMLLQDHRADPTQAIAWLTASAAWSGPAAEISIWLRLPPDGSITRAEARGRRTYTREQRAYLHHVHDAYTALADHDPSLIPLDGAGLDPAEIHRSVLRLAATHVHKP
jgi:dTMP kinase